LAHPSHSWTFDVNLPKQVVNGMWKLVCVLSLGLIQPSLQHDPSALDSLAQGTRSPKWQVRRDTFEQIEGNPKSTSDPKVSKLLVELRDVENIAASGGKTDLFEDDDYVAYDEQLTTAVEHIAVNSNNQSAWKALAYMRYNPDSVTGKWLAHHKQTLPYFMKQATSSNYVRRMNAAYILALMLQQSKQQGKLDKDEYIRLKSIVRRLAVYDIAPVQQFAAKGLGLIGDLDDVRILEEVRDNAKDPYTKNFATDALTQIRLSNNLTQPGNLAPN
jgi:hypothetical protein